MSAPVTYDRDVLTTVLVYHWPTQSSGCWCGWAVLGASFPEHVADVYEASVTARDEVASMFEWRPATGD